jgi:hypothetical protein
MRRQLFSIATRGHSQGAARAVDAAASFAKALDAKLLIDPNPVGSSLGGTSTTFSSASCLLDWGQQRARKRALATPNMLHAKLQKHPDCALAHSRSDGEASERPELFAPQRATGAGKAQRSRRAASYSAEHGVLKRREKNVLL